MPTANQNSDKVIKTEYQKYIKTSSRYGNAPLIWKRTQV